VKTKEELKEEIFKLEKEIVRLEVSLEKTQEARESLEKLCSDQQDQILRLQDALVAREAPDAYADRKEDEALPDPTPEEVAAAKRDRELADANRRLLDKMGEDHYFESADDMIDILTRGAVPVFERLHQNDES
jgi:hypothetical protein